VPAAAREERTEHSLALLGKRVAEAAGRVGEIPPLRVLIAEDNPVNQQVAAQMLQSLGVRADVAATGREAVDMARLAPYDLILMDCQMQVLNSHEAAAETRCLEGAVRETPIVAMTAGVEECEQRCLQCGMNDRPSKPVQILRLREVLWRWAPAAERKPLAETVECIE
jgi:two-component system sensor histidine kinase/response regulator